MTNKQFLGEVADIFFRIRNDVSESANHANRAVCFGLYKKFTTNGASLDDEYELESPDLMTEFTVATLGVAAEVSRGH